MKKITTFTILLLSGISLYGQTSDEERIQIRKHILNNILRATPNVNAAKPTEIRQRLIGIKREDNINNPPFESHDTTRIYYSGQRGSQFNYGTFEYNISLNSFNEPLAEALSVRPAFANEINADSLVFESTTGHAERYAVGYHNGDLKKEIEYSFSGSTYKYQTSVTYDNNNHATGVDYSIDNQPPYMIRSITYNAAYTRILSDTMRSISSASDFFVWKYTYYPNDQIKELESISFYSNGPVNNSKFLFTYDANSRLETMKEFIGDATGLLYTPVHDDSFYYEGTNPIFKGHFLQDYDWGGAPMLTSLEVKHFNVNGIPDTVHFYVIDPLNPNPGDYVSFVVNEYNEFDNPVTQKFYERDANYAFRIWKYYYQNYNTGIDDFAYNQDKLTVYPNPACDRFFIQWMGEKPIKNAAITIIDNFGRTVRATTQTLHYGENEMPVGDLKQGNYLLTIQDENGQRIVRKLVKI